MKLYRHIFSSIISMFAFMTILVARQTQFSENNYGINGNKTTGFNQISQQKLFFPLEYNKHDFQNDYCDNEAGNVSGFFVGPSSYDVNVVCSTVDATTAKKLSNVKIMIYKDSSIESLETAQTNQSGALKFKLLPGKYKFVVQKNKFFDWQGEVFIPKTQKDFTVKIAMSPVLLKGMKMRIVLTWGASPRDLDAHLFQSSDFHVYYKTKKKYTDAILDVDDTSSYGPETITIRKFKKQKYRVSIHDYTNRKLTSSMQLANSRAQVKVYRLHGETLTFDVPEKPGNTWNVFTIDGNTEQITVEDKMSNQKESLHVGETYLET